MVKNIGKNIIKNFSGKCNQKLLDAEAADAPKATSTKVIHKTAEATGDLNDNTIANRITKVSKIS